MKKGLLLLIYMVIAGVANSQRLESIFKMLPANCIPDLTIAQRDTLLNEGEYILPNGDTTDTEQYTIEIDTSNNTLLAEWSFTTGQRAFANFELHLFTETKGRRFVVLSECTGVPVGYQQKALRIFYVTHDTLREDVNQKLLPASLSVADFLKPNTPASIKTKLKGYDNICYSFAESDANTVDIELNSSVPEDCEKWFITFAYTFTWNGHAFVKQAMDKD